MCALVDWESRWDGNFKEVKGYLSAVEEATAFFNKQKQSGSIITQCVAFLKWAIENGLYGNIDGRVCIGNHFIDGPKTVEDLYGLFVNRYNETSK
jgi:hypothetical protein